VANGIPVHPDVVVIAEVEELLPGELGTIVSDNGIQDAESMDDVGEELHRFLGR
jgi:hypothetical protein